MMPTDCMEVVLTPLKVTDPDTQVMRIERVSTSELMEKNIHHVAGGQHQGIIVQKAVPGDVSSSDPDTQRMLIAHLADHNNMNNAVQEYIKEKRILNFWFQPSSRQECETISDLFFDELVNPHHIPRDYVHFVKRVLCLVKKFPAIHKTELIMKKLSGDDDETASDFNGKSQDDFRKLIDVTGTQSGGEIIEQSISMSATKEKQRKRKLAITKRGWQAIWAIKKQKLMQILEDAYPSVMSMDDLIRHSKMRAGDVQYLMDDLKQRGSVKDVDKNQFIRIPDSQRLVFQPATLQRKNLTMERSKKVIDDTKRKVHEFKIVAHVPNLPPKDQPTIAIVTLIFCEKVAVDAMMDVKTTYIRVKKGEGEGQVYTVGKIGQHIVVSTKLSRIGHGEGAMMAAGNTVTRLLGTFPNIQHVMLVGVGGAMASSGTTNIQLGDIVASYAETTSEPVYIHCRKVKTDETDEGKTIFVKDSWNPQDLGIMKNMSSLKDDPKPWEKCIDEAEEELSQSETKFKKPTGDFEKPKLHLGKVGSGKKMLLKDEDLKQKFAEETGCLCIDSGFQAVMQSIKGNRNDSFTVIRGISDYQDGNKSREWQPYASLVAAAFMKAVILQLVVGGDELDEDDDD